MVYLAAPKATLLLVFFNILLFFPLLVRFQKTISTHFASFVDFLRISNLEHNDWSVLRINLFLFDPFLTNKKSYKSYMTKYEI